MVLSNVIAGVPITAQRIEELRFLENKFGKTKMTKSDIAEVWGNGEDGGSFLNKLSAFTRFGIFSKINSYYFMTDLTRGLISRDKHLQQESLVTCLCNIGIFSDFYKLTLKGSEVNEVSAKEIWEKHGLIGELFIRKRKKCCNVYNFTLNQSLNMRNVESRRLVIQQDNMKLIISNYGNIDIQVWTRFKSMIEGYIKKGGGETL